MKLKNKLTLKSQAALEFLTTYGWAFLVILIMIGTLAYFGILSPSRILPDRCTMGPEFTCENFQVTPTQIKIRLKNNLGESVATLSASVGTSGASSLTCTVNPPPIAAWKTGEVIDFTFDTCTNANAAGIVSGEKGKVNITVDYYTLTGGSAYLRQVAGEIYATVR